MNDIINCLKNGGIVAIPTDTVYGIVCDATNPNAINKIYDVKKRDTLKAISIFVKDINQVYKYTNGISVRVKKIMDKYWPGPLTIIFEKKSNVLPYLNPGYNTIGIRIPNNKLLLDILSNVDFPLAQTSCNISGERPIYDSSDIYKFFMNKIDLVVNGRVSKNSMSSTVIDVKSGNIFVLRHGTISEKEGF